MKSDKGALFASFILGFFAGMAIISIIENQREKRQLRFKKLKEDIDKGFLNDNENLKSDWQNIYSDLDRTLEKQKKKNFHETI